MWEQQPQNSQLSTASSLSFLFFLRHAKILSIEESGTATACSPPAMLASYHSYCTEAVARLHESKLNWQKSQSAQRSFSASSAKKRSGKRTGTSSEGLLATSGRLAPRNGRCRCWCARAISCCALVKFLMQISKALHEKCCSFEAWGDPQGLCSKCKQM